MRNQNYNVGYVITYYDTKTERNEKFIVLGKQDAYDTFVNLKQQFVKRYPIIGYKGEDGKEQIMAYADETDKTNDQNRIAYASMEKLDVKRTIFPQTANDYEDEGGFIIDAWPSTDENDENGRSVVKVDYDGHTKYLTDNEDKDKGGRHCTNVFSKIEETITEIVYGEM